jgi:Protein of unknown function (DUF1553)/Protein of unknown function (DUF1549)/Planctomycete cytochrome C
MNRLPLLFGWIVLPALCSISAARDDNPDYANQIAPLLKTHCVKCHGPAKQERGLNLSTAANVAWGNDHGAVVVPHDLEASRLWKQVEGDEMPPDMPLSDAQKTLLQQWILSGAQGLSPAVSDKDPGNHWAFRTVNRPTIPTVANSTGLVNGIDYFIQASLEASDIKANAEAAKRTLIRRVSSDVTGLPPSLEDLDRFLADSSSDAYSLMVDRYLASPQFGVRWGKHWLDAAGYADSNGYFNADSDRPLAYRYRDYVIRCINQDKPFDRFITEQLAGDELAQLQPEQPVTPENVELWEATHFLRNGQDGSGESDGNPDEVRADRYYALESVMQNTATTLLGLTIQCAKCHDHKFEPLSQLDYYRWQAVFYPSFNIESWVKPNDRFVYASLPNEQLHWEQQKLAAENRVKTLRTELDDWMKSHRVNGEILFEDRFDTQSAGLAAQWRETAPGDDSTGGSVAVKLDTESAPAAVIKDGKLWVIEGGTQGDSWLSTQRKFDWTPDKIGESIQVTFDLVDNKLPNGVAAERIGYFIALHDFDDNSGTLGGNLLIDGNPTEGTAIHLDYPGADSRSLGTLGTTGYVPGQNYGVRVTNLDNAKFRIEQLVNSFPDDKPIDVKKEDLPDGGFGFEYCCGRSFIVDNVLIERIVASPTENPPTAELRKRQKEVAQAVKQHAELVANRPGKIAWGADMASELPEVHLLARGNYAARAEIVEPGTFSIFADDENRFEVAPRKSSQKSSGRRLAWAKWLTRPESKAASLMARVQVNRLWQQYFGKGIVTTPENFGISGAPPSHPELLDWLAAELIRNDWSMKSIHRLVLNSATYRRSSELQTDSYNADQNSRLLWRFLPRRLDAETIRDQMLAVSGDLNLAMGGPYVATKRLENGEVVAPEDSADSSRRSIYLNQKRTQVVSFLAVFDAPSIVFNSVRRNTSTMSLQSLSLLNSDFAVRRAQAAATLLKLQTSDDRKRIEMAFQRSYSRWPSDIELSDSIRFLDQQTQLYAERNNAREQAWQDLCQSLMASSEFLYVE